MTIHIETDNLTDQNISTALEIGSYTADGDRSIFAQFFADQIAGGGSYTYYVTLRIAGSGSAYVISPKTIAIVDGGVTAISGQSGMINVRNTDVVKVYLLGLATDTTTVDTTVRWFEADKEAPTAADNADAIWDEAYADHVGAGSFGHYVGDILTSSSSAANDASDIHVHVNAMVNTDLPAIKADTAAILVDTGTTLDGLIDDIKAKTDNIPAVPASTGDAMTLTAAYDKAKDDVLTPLAVIDGLVDAIKAKTDNLPTDPADESLLEAAISAVTAPTAAAVADAVHDEVIEGTLTLRKIMRLMLAVLTGKASGGGTTTIAFRDVADAKNRISSTVNADGDRTSVTLDGD